MFQHRQLQILIWSKSSCFALWTALPHLSLWTQPPFSGALKMQCSRIHQLSLPVGCAPTGPALNQYPLPLAPFHKNKSCHPDILVIVTSRGQIQAPFCLDFYNTYPPVICLSSCSLNVNNLRTSSSCVWTPLSPWNCSGMSRSPLGTKVLLEEGGPWGRKLEVFQAIFTTCFLSTSCSAEIMGTRNARVAFQTPWLPHSEKLCPSLQPWAKPNPFSSCFLFCQ